LKQEHQILPEESFWELPLIMNEVGFDNIQQQEKELLLEYGTKRLCSERF
jgi:hypothetical protein